MSEHPDMKLITMELEGWGCPKVEHFGDEDRRPLLIDPDEIVVPDEQIRIEFRYPLAQPVYFSYTKKGGFTRMEVFRLIYEVYKKIYEEEEQEVGDPGIYENLYNRRPSRGKYGIWGHYMSDLWIEFVYYHLEEKTIYLYIGS